MNTKRLTNTRQAPLFNNRTLAGYIEAISQENVVCVPNFLHNHTRTRMLEELDEMTLEEAAPEVGPFNIKQSYRYTTSFPESSLYYTARSALQEQINATCKAELPEHLSAQLQFNDLVVQRYNPTDVGISPHRDGRKYLNIIAVFVLEGQGRFCTCENREGKNPRKIRNELRNEPGDLLLMRAPGFNSEDIQPFHFVDQIKTQRTSLALRHNRIADTK